MLVASHTSALYARSSGSPVWPEGFDAPAAMRDCLVRGIEQRLFTGKNHTPQIK